MSRIAIAPIVEGHGDSAAVRDLLWRIWYELAGGEHAEVLRPIRQPRGKILQEGREGIGRAVELAALKLASVKDMQKLVLVLVDAEDDCIGASEPLGPKLLGNAREWRADMDISVVVANVMYETWCVACAESMADVMELKPGDPPDDPEAQRCGKGWIKERMGRYSPTADQAALTSRIDLQLCRRRSRSFDKLCREIVKRRPGATP